MILSTKFMMYRLLIFHLVCCLAFSDNNSAGRNMSREDREDAVKEQLKRMYGWRARDYSILW